MKEGCRAMRSSWGKTQNIKMLAPAARTLKDFFNEFLVALGHLFNGRQFAGREPFQDVIVKLNHVVHELLDGGHCFLRISKAWFAQYALRVHDALDPSCADVAMAGNGIAVDVAATVDVARGEISFHGGILGILMLAQLREKRLGDGLLSLAGMLEGIVVWTAVRFVHQGLAHHPGDIYEKDHGRNLVPLAEFLNR